MSISPGTYSHYKRGDKYEVIGIALTESNHQEVVVYQALYGDNQLYVRPLAEFIQKVEKDGKQVLRFTPINKAEL